MKFKFMGRLGHAKFQYDLSCDRYSPYEDFKYKDNELNRSGNGEPVEEIVIGDDNDDELPF